MIKMTSVEKALKILKCFNENEKELSLNDLAAKLAIPKPSLYRLCYILSKEGFLSKNTKSNTYRLGIQMLEIASVYINRSNFVGSIENTLEELSKEVEETVIVYKLEGFSRKCIMRFESEHALRHAVSIGEKLPLNKGATGKVILSFMTEKNRNDYFDFLDLTSNEKLRMEEELNNIREDGYYISMGERDKFLASAAVPLFNGDIGIFGALGVSGPIQRFREEFDDSRLKILIKYGDILNNLVKFL